MVHLLRSREIAIYQTEAQCIEASHSDYNFLTIRSSRFPSLFPDNCLLHRMEAEAAICYSQLTTKKRRKCDEVFLDSKDLSSAVVRLLLDQAWIFHLKQEIDLCQKF